MYITILLSISIFLITREGEHPFTLTDLLGSSMGCLCISCTYFFVVLVATDVCSAIGLSFLTHVPRGSSLSSFYFESSGWL